MLFSLAFIDLTLKTFRVFLAASIAPIFSISYSPSHTHVRNPWLCLRVVKLRRMDIPPVPPVCTDVLDAAMTYIGGRREGAMVREQGK